MALKDSLTSLVETAIGGVKSGRVRAEPEEATRRWNICLACPKFMPDTKKCGICKCWMGIKVNVHAASCADKSNQKW